MSFRGVLASLVALLVVLVGILIQQSFLLRYMLSGHLGLITKHELTDNSKCYTIPNTEACEKLSIHQPTGHVYMGCSTIADRLAWSPYFNIYRSWTPSSDYAAVYDPSTKTFTRLQIEGLPEPDPDHPRGLHAHGLHVVSSSTDPNTVFVYLVNHRPQPYGSETYGKEDLVGADEAVQIFKTTIGSSVLTHVATFDDPSVVITPNDISGSADGKSFFFTNDEPARSGPEGKWARVRRLWFNAPITTVGYCHVDEGCKTVASGISSANGIVRVNEDTIWVANAITGVLSIFSRQSDNTLVLIETVSVNRPVDNLSTDGKGNVYGGIYIGDPTQIMAHLHDPIKHKIQSAVYNVSLNTGTSAFYGEKWKIEKIFEDDGSVINGVTTGAYDPERKLLYATGLMSSAVAICPM